MKDRRTPQEDTVYRIDVPGQTLYIAPKKVGPESFRNIADNARRFRQEQEADKHGTQPGKPKTTP